MEPLNAFGEELSTQALLDFLDSAEEKLGRVPAKSVLGAVYVYEYWRYSTPNQRFDSSTARQDTAATRYAAGLNLEIAKVFGDPETSGAIWDRQGLNELFEHLEANPGSIVIVEDMSRLCRTFDAFIHIYARLRKAKAVLHLVHGGLMSNLLAAIFAAIAEVDRFHIKRRMHSGRLTKLGPEKHDYNQYGYIRGPDGVLRIDPETAPNVELIFGLAARGNGVSAIMRELHRLNIPSPRGKNWWPYTTIEDLIKNPIYAGVTVYNYKESLDDETSQLY